MDILKSENADSLITFAYYNECQHCRVVDKEFMRKEKGFQCPVCNRESSWGAHKYFNIAVFTLLELIQDIYFTNQSDTQSIEDPASNATGLSVLIFFCTLREVLLDNLIYIFISLHNLSENIETRLLADNRNYTDKMNKLFPSLAGIKSWNEAINLIEKKSGKEYKSVNAFLEKASRIRNEFLHEGDDISFDQNMKKECFENVFKLIELYVDFHNFLIHPVYFERLKKKG